MSSLCCIKFIVSMRVSCIAAQPPETTSSGQSSTLVFGEPGRLASPPFSCKKEKSMKQMYGVSKYELEFNKAKIFVI